MRESVMKVHGALIQILKFSRKQLGITLSANSKHLTFFWNIPNMPSFIYNLHLIIIFDPSLYKILYAKNKD